MNRFKQQHNPAPFYQRSLIGIFSILIFALQTGCASTSKPIEKEYSESLTKYTETLFRRQNQASSTLMILSEDEFDEMDYQALLEAEQEMHSACQSFNEYASILSEGSNPGILLRNKVYRSLDECDTATQNLELLLQQLE